MKRLLTSRILACLIFLTIWGSKTYAQGSISSYTAGTETFEITSNTRIPKHDTEYQYYASANISLFIGAKEVWKNPKKIGSKYYLSSQGNPGIQPDGSSNVNQQDGSSNVNQIDAGFDKTKSCIALPNTGNYFHFLFHTKGIIKLDFNVKYARSGNKNLYIEKPTKNNVTLTNNGNNYTTKIGISSKNTKVTLTGTTITGTTITEPQSGDNRYFNIEASAGDHSMVIEIAAEAGEEYYI